MEAKYIGLCALFRGVEMVADYLKIPKDEVQAYRSLVSHKKIPFFEELRTCVIDATLKVGLDRASKMLSISLVSLYLITENSRYAKSTPDHAPSSSISTSQNSAPKKKVLPKKNKPIAIDIISPEPKTQKSYDNPITDLYDLEDLKQRVSKLYNHGVRVKVIMSLYDIQNVAYIHSWGGWDRSKVLHDKAYEMKRQIANMREDRMPDFEICRELGIRHFKLKEIMGEMPRKKLIFMKKDIKMILNEYKERKRKDKIARMNGITESQIDYWLEKKAKKQLDTVYDINIIGPIEILNALESYYIHEKIELAAQDTEVDEKLLCVLVKKFESKMNEYYAIKNKNNNWNQKSKKFYIK